MANYPQLNKEVQQGEMKVVMHTNKGDMTFKLFPDIAPKTVENFVTHAKNGYYDGITFHRVINDFMIQRWRSNSYWYGWRKYLWRCF